MSYEDLEEARAKRAAKEKAAADKDKGKHGRKRKDPEPEMGLLVPKDKMIRLSEVPEPTKVSAMPWRAPVARMHQHMLICFDNNVTLRAM